MKAALSSSATAPPEVRRRGAGLHDVYDYIAKKILPSVPGGKIQQIHRARGSNPHTIFFVTSEDGARVQEIVVVRWRDDGTNFEVLEVVPSEGLDPEDRAGLEGLFRP